MKMRNKLLATLLVGAMTVVSITGCGNADAEASNKTSTVESAQQKEESKASQNSTEKAEESTEITYPLDGNETVTFWAPLIANIASVTDNMGNTPFAEELEKRTGVEIEFVHPTAGQNNESLALMIASDELTDIVFTDWTSYKGGPVQAINEEVIIDISKYKEYAPNYFKFLSENPEYDRAAKTDDGAYYGFVGIQDGGKLLAVMGPALRKDWLDELGLEMPETVSDWENILTAFKEKKGATAPFSFSYNTYKSVVFSMFEARWDVYVKNGEAVYGPAQPEFKKALETLNDWYNKGLLDKNLFAVDKATIDSQVLNDVTGAIVGHGGSGIGTYQLAGLEKNPNFSMMAAKLPTYEEGKVSSAAKINAPVSGAMAITTSCKNPELAIAMLDYLYSEEGRLLTNYGVEGLTFTYDENNVPKYTDLITNNPDGLSMSQALGQYVLAGNGAMAFVQDEGYIEQYYNYPEQIATFTTWAENVEGALAETMPPITPTSEESEEYATIMSNVNQHRNEMVIKFINGTEPIEKFDEYVNTLNKFGLERAVEIYNDALARYYDR